MTAALVDNDVDETEDETPSASASGSFGGYSDGSSLIADLGSIAVFGAELVKTLPQLRHYLIEVVHQAAIMIFKSTAIIWFMMCMLAAEIGLEAHYLLSQLGAGGYTAVFSSTADYTVAPEMWGWILSAKVACGLVAELGSMRISEEIDALEVMGFDSKAYLVVTRLVAVLIVTPFMFLAGTALMYVLGYYENVHYLHSVSAGGYLSVFWDFTTQSDLIRSLGVAMLMSVLIILVGCYYGYNASGGPVGVGKNTAKSMVINLVIVSVLGAVFQQLFFAGLTRAPISF